MIKRFLTACLAVLLTFGSSITAYGEETTSNTILKVEEREGSEILTLDKAIEKAKRNSSALKKTNSSIEASDEERSSIYNTFIYSTSENNLAAIISLLKFDASYSNTVRTQAVQIETLENTMTKTYIEIINAERALALEKMALKNAQNNLAVDKVKVKLGLIGEQEYSNQELTYKKSEASIDKKEKAIDEAYTSLNILIGEDSTKKYQLSLEPVYTELVLPGDLESYINVKISTDPNVKEKETALQLAEDNLKYYNTSSSESYAALNNNINDASLSLRDEKKNLEEKIREYYNSIMTLESEYKNNLEQMDILKKQLETAQKKYDMNLITEIELNDTIYKVAELESTITGQIYEHMTLLLQFEKPYL